MIKWIIILAVVAIVAGMLGFTRLSGAAATGAKILTAILLIFIVLIFFGVFAVT